MNANVVKAGDGKAISIGNTRLQVKEDGSRTRGMLGLAEFEIPPGGTNTPPLHVHYAHEEGFYVLEGELEFQAGTDTVRVGRGGFVMVPIGIPHTFRNPTDKPARFLNTFTPRHYLDYFAEMSQLFQSNPSASPLQAAEVMAHFRTERVEAVSGNSDYAAVISEPSVRRETLSNGLTIRFDECGEGRPVLILHGGAGPQSVTGFSKAIAEHGAHVLTPTHPGFGGEPRPAWVDTIADLALGYLDLLEKLNLFDVTVVGFSVGGWIASEMAVRDTSRLGRVVIVDGTGIQVDGQEVANVFPLTSDELNALSYHNPAVFSFDPSKLTAVQMAGRKANMQALEVFAGPENSVDPKLRRRLGRVKIPALVIWGESDGVVTPNYGRAYAEAFPKGRFELIRESGHMPQIEQPDRLIALVEAFM